MDPSAAELAASLEAQLPSDATGLAVALSGGADSACLLAAARACADATGLPVRAVHVDHGLQPSAAEFRRVCAALAARLGAPLRVLTVQVTVPPGASLEAAAREARYAALAAALADGECLLTAHHAEDQAETVLLQALRGAGLAGLAGMPASRRLGRGWHLRPLLGVRRRELADCAAALRLETIVDPMNLDPAFDRVYLRLRVWPALEARWPGAAAALGRAAAHVASAQELLGAAADDDLARLRDGAALSIPRLRALAEPRRANALRRWIAEHGLRPPPSARLAEALRQFLGARRDQMPAAVWEAHALRRYRDRIFVTAASPPRLSGALRWNPRTQATLELGEGLGRLRCAARAGALAAERLPETLLVTGRRGGESLQIAPRAATRTVQHLCQSEGVLPWMRAALPFVYAGDRLIAVGDLWSDARARAARGETGVAIEWDGAPAVLDGDPPDCRGAGDLVT